MPEALTGRNKSSHLTYVRVPLEGRLIWGNLDGLGSVKLSQGTHLLSSKIPLDILKTEAARVFIMQ